MKTRISLAALLFLAIGFVMRGGAQAAPVVSLGPSIVSVSVSPTSAQANDTLTLSVTYSDAGGPANINRAWIGFSNCTVDPGEAYDSNFERNFANYFGAIIYNYSGSFSYLVAQLNAGAACTGGQVGGTAWGSAPPLKNAVGTTEVTALTRSTSGNNVTFVYTIKLTNHAAGTFPIYAMAKNTQNYYSNNTTGADWTKTATSVTVLPPPTPTPIPNNAPTLQSITVSPNPATANSLLTFTAVFADPQGGSTIKRAYLGFSPCSAALYAANQSYFEHNLANSFAVVGYPPSFGNTFLAAQNNTNGDCSNTTDANAVWGSASAYANAWTSTLLKSVTFSTSGNTLTVVTKVQLLDYPDGTYNLYYAVLDELGAFQNGGDNQWDKIASPQLTINASSSELQTINTYRAVAGLPAVTSNSTWEAGNISHARYLVKNNALLHTESTTNAWYSLEGASAGQSSLLLGAIGSGLSDTKVIDKWISGPFHALGILDPRLTQVGYGAYRESMGNGGYQLAAGLDVYRGIDYFATPTYPVFYPSNGATSSAARYSGGETPDPLSACAGYTTPSGPPIIVQFGSGATRVNVTASSFSQGATSLTHCVYTETSYTNSDAQQQAQGRSILGSHDAVVLIPRNILSVGQTYTVMLTVNGTVYNWSFTVASTNPTGNVSATILPVVQP